MCGQGDTIISGPRNAFTHIILVNIIHAMTECVPVGHIKKIEMNRELHFHNNIEGKLFDISAVVPIMQLTAQSTHILSSNQCVIINSLGANGV